ncbi:tail protein X [Pseudomonas leptonychotis]|uniref:Phage tail protein n=1 Tax=Pseudomonas leptonychotis TaxID=2448482 RepID=A0A4T2A3R6_9PSED|nr:tail protein X [Pseudomonas leptonychotis]TIH10839.1 phage tail protein [Pseudomonas leptonychotis]
MASVRALQGDTVDAICWRYYGRTAGVVEQVLDANPGLADLGPVLPNGTLLNMPQAAAQAVQRQVVNLWD